MFGNVRAGVLDLFLQRARLQYFCIRPKPNQPAFDLIEVGNLESQNDAPIGLRFNMLARLPGALANVGGLRRRISETSGPGNEPTSLVW